MRTVFVGGSRRLRLRAEVRAQLEQICFEDATFLVGDAAGADRAVRQFLAQRAYRRVRIYYSGSRCRASESPSDWEFYEIHTGAKPKTRAFYEAKDEAMAHDCTEAVMIWDGKSLGTFRNLLRVLQRDKPVTVFASGTRGSKRLTQICDLRGLVACPSKPMQDLCLAEIRAIVEQDGEAAPLRGKEVAKHPVRQGLLGFAR